MQTLFRLTCASTLCLAVTAPPAFADCYNTDKDASAGLPETLTISQTDIDRMLAEIAVHESATLASPEDERVQPVAGGVGARTPEVALERLD